MKTCRGLFLLLTLIALSTAACDSDLQLIRPMEPTVWPSSPAQPTETVAPEEATPSPAPTASTEPTPVPTATAIPTATIEPYLWHYQNAQSLLDSSPLSIQLSRTRALDELNETIALNPEYGQAYVTRAQLYRDLAQPAKGLLDLQTALSLDPQNAEAYHVRAKIRYDEGDLERALDDLSQSIDLGSHDAQVFAMRGDIESQFAQFNAALDDLDEALALDPGYATALAMRSLVHLSLGNDSQAQEDIERALALDDQVAWYHYNQGIIMRSQGDDSLAAEAYTRAIALDPEMAWAYHNRGNIYRDLGELEKSLADLDMALTLDPDDALGYVNRGFTHYHLGDWDAALVEYNRAIELEPAFAWAYQKRAELELLSGQPELAYDDFTRAIELDPDYQPPWTGRARTLAILGRYEESLLDLEQARQLDPDYRYPDYLAGITYLEQGETEQALQTFDDILDELEVTFMSGNMSTGDFNSYAMTDRPTEAALARFGRGRTYMALGRVDEALQDFRQAVEHDAGSLGPELDVLLGNGREDDYLYLLHGLVQAGGGNWELSDADFQKAEEGGADRDLLVYFLRWRSQFAFGQGKENAGVIDLRQAIALAADSGPVYLELGMHYLAAGKFEEALATFDGALLENGDDIEALAFRGYVQSELGDREGAADDLCRALQLIDDAAAAGQPFSGEYLSDSALVSDLSAMQINCFLPEQEIAGLPNWPADLGLDDDFYAVPTHYHGIAPGDIAMQGSLGTREVQLAIGDSFWFTGYDNPHFVYGYAVYVPDDASMELFNGVARADLAEGLASFYAGGEDFTVVASSAIEGGDTVGDWSTGDRVEYEAEGETFRHEKLSFTVDGMGVSLFQRYTAESAPPIDMVSTAAKLAAAIHK